MCPFPAHDDPQVLHSRGEGAVPGGFRSFDGLEECQAESAQRHLQSVETSGDSGTGEVAGAASWRAKWIATCWWF